MKTIPLVTLLIFASGASVAQLPDDFWDNCPGPACPANRPNFQDMEEESSIEAREREFLKKERELLDRERRLFEREHRIIHE